MKENKFPYPQFRGLNVPEQPLSEAEFKALDEQIIESFYRFAEEGLFYLIVSQQEADRLSQDEGERKRRLSDAAFKVFVAATHFVNVSPSAWDISVLVRTTPQEVINYSKTPLWQLLLDNMGFKGDRTPHLHDPRERMPKYLREDVLILQSFQKTCPVRFITYEGFTDARVKQVKKFTYLLEDGRELKKHDVILAFPQDRMEYVKRGIKVRKSIAAVNLRPIQRRRDRVEVYVGARRGALVECILQNGLVVTGENIWISKYNIVMRVGGSKKAGGKVILVYRHALLQFQVLKPLSDGTSDDFEEASETDDGAETRQTLERVRRSVDRRNQQSQPIAPWIPDDVEDDNA